MQIIKLLPFLFLIVLAQNLKPQTNLVEQTKLMVEDLGINWDGVLKCIQEAHPVAKNILALIDAIKNKDFGKALNLALDIIKDGSQLIKRCIEAFKFTKVDLEINWDGVKECLLSIGSQIPGIAKLVAAIVTHQYWAIPGILIGLVGPAIEIFNKCKRMFS